MRFIYNGTSFVTVHEHTVVEENVTFGLSCVFGSCVFVGRFSTFGNNVRIQHGAFICRRAIIGDNVFIGPNAMLIDDKYPVAGNFSYKPNPPTLKDGCSIGAGAVIMPGVTIGERAMIGAGAVVINDVPDDATVMGVPAQERKHGTCE